MVGCKPEMLNVVINNNNNNDLLSTDSCYAKPLLGKLRGAKRWNLFIKNVKVCSVFHLT